MENKKEDKAKTKEPVRVLRPRKPKEESLKAASSPIAELKEEPSKTETIKLESPKIKITREKTPLIKKKEILSEIELPFEEDTILPEISEKENITSSVESFVATDSNIESAEKTEESKQELENTRGEIQRERLGSDGQFRQRPVQPSFQRKTEPLYNFDGIIISEGILEIMQDGYGFLRSSD